MPTIDALRDLLWERDGGICGICGICGEPVERVRMDMDHVIPRSHGGPDSFANLRTAHGLCNRKRGNGREIQDYSAKFLIRLPAPLHSDLTRLARSESCSLNAQIVRVLREWAAKEDAYDDAGA